jgi:hypothetical protein
MIKYIQKALSVFLFATTITLGSVASHAVGINTFVFTGGTETKAVSTAGTHSFQFTNLTAVPANGTVTYTAPSTYTVTAPTATCSAGGVFSSTGQNLVCTYAAGIAANSTVTLSVSAGVTTPATVGNYAWIMRTSSNDFSAALQYVGQANVVTVRAFVPNSLSFVIRNTADTADYITSNNNVCDLGIQSTTTTTTCSYRLKVATNAKNGYQVFMRANRAFCNDAPATTPCGGTTYSIANGASTSAGTAVAAGTEIYGAAVKLGSVTAGGGAVQGGNGTTNVFSNYTGTFTAGTNNVSNYTYNVATELLRATKGNSPATTDLTNTSEVTHAMAIGANTEAGAYEHTITYTVVPSF